MIAILDDNDCFVNDEETDVRKFLIGFVDYFGCCDIKIFKILASSEEMTIKELIDYINNHVDRYQRITQIYKLSDKIY